MEINQILKDFQLILASGSPRRKFLLEGLGWGFSVRPTAIDETPQGLEFAEICAQRLAEEKALACPWGPNELILAADTLVALNGQILNKPGHPEEAVRMLSALSGQWHEVITGVAVRYDDVLYSAYVITKVEFRKLTSKEIKAYVDTGEPLDKAGAYGIQGHGGALVASIMGDYPSVVGLPIKRTMELMRKVVEAI